jgi:hypothetical protein
MKFAQAVEVASGVEGSMANRIKGRQGDKRM